MDQGHNSTLHPLTSLQQHYWASGHCLIIHVTIFPNNKPWIRTLGNHHQVDKSLLNWLRNGKKQRRKRCHQSTTFDCQLHCLWSQRRLSEDVSIYTLYHNIYEQQTWRLASRILLDPAHALFSAFEWLPSWHRVHWPGCRSQKRATFFPRAVHVCVYIYIHMLK